MIFARVENHLDFVDHVHECDALQDGCGIGATLVDRDLFKHAELPDRVLKKKRRAAFLS